MVTGRGFLLKNRMPPEFFIQEAFFMVNIRVLWLIFVIKT